MTKRSLAQDRLKEFLDYCPETGEMIWKKSGGRRRQGQEAGYLNPMGYRMIGFCGKEHFAHRLIWFWMKGEWPECEIDHINHNTYDNRWANLRPTNHLENCRNISKKKNNASGINGVYWSKTNRKWIANISVDGKTIYLGSFIDIHDAAVARKLADIKYDFHKNHGVDKHASI